MNGNGLKFHYIKLSLRLQVTINVNFCHPVRVLAAADASPKATIPSAAAIQSLPARPEQRPEQRPDQMPALRPAVSPPAVILQRHHHSHPYEMEEGGMRLASSREAVQLKMIGRPLPPPLHHHQPQREEYGANYPAGDAIFRRDYAPMSRMTREQHPQQQVVAPPTHSSRWSHLMAKRTHTP